MKASELREMSGEQLQATLNDTIGSLFKLRLQSQSERVEAPGEIRRMRRLIARIRTVFRERELVSAASADTSGVEAVGAETDSVETAGVEAAD